MRKEQAEIVTFWHKALAAPSSVKLEKQTLLKQRNAPFKYEHQNWLSHGTCSSEKSLTYIGFLD